MARPKVHTEEVRELLVQLATEDVASGGLGTVVLRDLAGRAGTTTRAVYALFGSKEELQVAVLVRAFEDFAADQAHVDSTEDAVRDLAELGARYVQWALEHPRLYAAMFGDAIAPEDAGDELRQVRDRAFGPLGDAVGRALATGAFRPADRDTVTASLWAQVHGLASLILAGQLPAGADPATAAFATIQGWLDN